MGHRSEASRGGPQEGPDPWVGPGEDEPEAAALELAEDLEAVERAKQGDRGAFARLYRRYGPLVHGVLLARVDRAEVSDLVQEVFITALRRLADLRDPAAFGGWIVQVARSRAADHHRRRKPTEVLSETDASSNSPSAATEALAVLRTIRGLPEAYRETLVLRLVEGMTGPEIALRTGLTAGSVRVNLHRGMRLLREALEGGSTDV
jgi:RNA polymerase sigma-70 factor, ECF subfamily